MKYTRIQWVFPFISITISLAMDNVTNNDPHFAYSKHLIEQHHLNPSEFDSIIDVGCRNGLTTRYLHSRTHPQKTVIIGLDPSTTQIVDAKMYTASLVKAVRSPSLTRKMSYSSSPLETSILSPLPSEIDLAVHATNTPFAECSFYQQSISEENSIQPENRLQFYVDNLKTLSYAGKRAQLVTNFNTLHLFANKQQFFKNISALLKDNGTLFMATHIDSLHSKAIFDLLDIKVSETPWKELFHSFSIKNEYTPLTSINELKHLLQKHNFKKITMTTEERYCDTQENVSLYLEHEFCVFPTFHSLSPEQKKELCNAIAQDYIACFSLRDKRIPLPEAIIVQAHYHAYAPFSGLGWNH